MQVVVLNDRTETGLGNWLAGLDLQITEIMLFLFRVLAKWET